jgi:hypothetical protein
LLSIMFLLELFRSVGPRSLLPCEDPASQTTPTLYRSGVRDEGTPKTKREKAAVGVCVILTLDFTVNSLVGSRVRQVQVLSELVNLCERSPGLVQQARRCFSRAGRSRPDGSSWRKWCCRVESERGL